VVSARPRFTLVQLQYFVEAAETGNITVAAERLHASQSTLSSAIQRLEHELGCPLLVRHQARGVSLTPNGRELLARARDLLDRAAELTEVGRILQDEPVGLLRAGFFVTLAPFYLPEVLTRLHHSHPRIELDVVEADGTGLHTALRERQCEVALTYGLDIGEDMAFRALVEVRPYALVSARHPLAGREVATLRELAQRPMVMLDLPETSRFMLGMLKRAGARPLRILRTTNFETMRGLVAASDGFAILNQRPQVISPRPGAAFAVTIADAEPVSIGIMHLAATPLHRRMTAFVDACRDAARAIIGGDAPQSAVE
jgi:DNA-binding transcriptional LysR family regulator